MVVFSPAVERLAAFDKGVGFEEVFRIPTEGDPIHDDPALDGYRLGIASVASTRDDHGLTPSHPWLERSDPDGNPVQLVQLGQPIDKG